MTGNNLMVDSDGSRRCRICRNESRRRARARAKASLPAKGVVDTPEPAPVRLAGHRIKQAVYLPATPLPRETWRGKRSSPRRSQSDQAELLLRERAEAAGYATEAAPYRYYPPQKHPPNPGGPHTWTPDEHDTLKLMFARGDPIVSIAAYFDVSYGAVCSRARRLGIKHLFKSRTISQRFNCYIVRDPKSDCLLWAGACNSAGHPQIAIAHRTKLATHVALALAGIEIPPGREVAHSCDNLRCVNSEHLQVRERRENTRRDWLGGQTCRRGHLLGPRNFAVTANGKRYCRACANERARRRYAERKKAVTAA